MESLDNQDNRLHRMLLAYVRQEFEAPVGAILGYAEIMLEDAEQQGYDSLLGDSVAEVGDTSSDRHKRAILESEVPIL